MLSQQALHQFLDNAARSFPNQTAVVEPGNGSISYLELDALSDAVRDRLVYQGVQPGDRVGIYLHKSIDSVASIFGVLKTGAAYVPVDPGAPVARNAYILSDCSVRAAIVEKRFLDSLKAEYRGETPSTLVIEATGGGKPLKQALRQEQMNRPAPLAVTVVPESEDLAYILYTSGSTGKPKGVMLAHQAAISYVDWCSEVFTPDAQDRFSSHAPFHFDLSILDIYLPIKHGATLILISEEIGKDPLRLASLISEQRISNWYSTPSILSLLAQYGRLDDYDYSALHTVLFAGEVFPVKHLRVLKQLLPMPRYFNLYGPTETNVCTFYEVPEHIPADRTQPYPIGKACSHYEIKVIDRHENQVPSGEEGELCGAGPGVMDGYWNLPERSANAFLVDGDGRRWYKTGDIVFEDENGDFIFVGRRDRMVKKRGYRVELGEIEAGLYRHPAIEEAAVIAFSDEEDGVRIQACISHKGDERPSLIDLKRFCAENLPMYMIPDTFTFYTSLPKTSTDKINYQELMRMGSN